MATATSTLPSSRQIRVVKLVLDHLVWLILGMILLICSVSIEHFFQIGIFINIAQHATYVGLLSLGLAFCVIAGHMDLSIESVMAFAAMLAAGLTAARGSPFAFQVNTWVAFVLILGFGALAGLFNAVLIVKMKLNAFVVTLATYIAIRGLGLILTGGRSIYGLPDDFRAVANADLLGLPMLVWITIVTYLIFGHILKGSLFGRRVYLVGGNPIAPFRAGVDVDRVLFGVFILSGTIAAFAGWLLAARTNGATPNLGVGMLFEAFAAVVIGGVSLRGGLGQLSGVFAGVLLLSTIGTAINVMGLDASYMQVIRGGLMLVAVLLDSVKTEIAKRLG